MKWFLLTLRGHYAVLAAVSLGIAAALLPKFSLVIPVLGPGVPFGELPLDVVIPLVIVILIGTLQSAASPAEAAASSRGVVRLMILFGASVIALFVATHAVTAVFLGTSSMPIARNTFGFFALMLLGHLVVSLRFAPLTPTLYLFLSTMFARGPDGSTQTWAWPMLPTHSWDLVLALVIAVTITAYALVKPPSRARLVFLGRLRGGS
jgi:hypothetical protein